MATLETLEVMVTASVVIKDKSVGNQLALTILEMEMESKRAGGLTILKVLLTTTVLLPNSYLPIQLDQNVSTNHHQRRDIIASGAQKIRRNFTNVPQFKLKAELSCLPKLPPTPATNRTLLMLLLSSNLLVDFIMDREFCLGCKRYFIKIKTHLLASIICRWVMNEHYRQLNQQHHNCITPNDVANPLVGTYIGASTPDIDDAHSLACSTRHAKKQRLAKCEDDDYSAIIGLPSMHSYRLANTNMIMNNDDANTCTRCTCAVTGRYA